MSFILSVGSDLAPVLQILAYCVLPSKNVVASSKNFNVEKCFKNKVCIVALEISLSLLYFTLLYYTIDLLYIQVKPEKIEYRAKVH